MRHALSWDQPKDLGRVGLARDDGTGALVDANQADDAAGDVELRHARQVDVLSFAAIPLTGGGHGSTEIRVGELSTLGMAGRAAGVVLDRDVVVRDYKARVGADLVIAPLEVAFPDRVAV